MMCSRGMTLIELMATLAITSMLVIGAIGVAPRNVWVNRFGKRFANEFIAFDFPFAANAVKRQKVAWAVFDENLKKFYMEKGIDAGLGILVPPGKKYPDFDELWDKAIASGNPYVVKATSLSDLAAKTKLPLENLKKTFEEYNRAAAANVDPAFAKGREWLHPIDVKGPLYAVKLREVLLVTAGGPKVDEFLRPLDKDDNVAAAGLYMAGNDVGGLYTKSYTLTSASGSSYGFAVNSGRMAAKTILAEMGKK